MKVKVVTLTLYLIIQLSAAAASMANNSQVSRIVGGDNAYQGEFPYQLSLQVSSVFGDHHICGASLVQVQDVQVAVTAAHCVFEREHFYFHLVAGELDLRNKSGLEQIRRVAKIIVHEEYSRYKHTNDIALLFLSHPFEIDEHVKPIALPIELQETTTGNITVSGWGRLQSEGDVPDILQKIITPVIAHEECKEVWEPYVEITEGMICSLGPNGEQSPCNGDSGGPATGTRKMEDDESDNRYLAGVVSFGHWSCSHPDLPAIFTNVSKFVGWINLLVGQF